MRSSTAVPLHRLVPLALLLAAVSAWAGEPIPDIDVILEQNPGGRVRVDSHTGGFDEVEITVGKDFARALSPISLPDGWSLETDGKKARLTGPAAPAGRPVRLELDASGVPRPKRISYRVRLDGRTLVERKRVPVRPVPARQVVGNLDGVVVMPTQVAPGEAMQMRVNEDADLPPDGTWTLSGTVVAEDESAEPENAETADGRRRVALAVPPEHADEVPDEALTDVATALAAHGAQAGSWEVTPLPADDPVLVDGSAEVWTVVRPAPGAPIPDRETDTDLRLIHDATGSIARQARPDRAAKDEEPTRWVRGVEVRRDGADGEDRGGITVLGVRSVEPGTDAEPQLVVASLTLGARDPAGRGERPGDPPGEQVDECESPSESSACCAEAGGTWTEDEELGDFCFLKLPVEGECLRPLPQPEDPELCDDLFGPDGADSAFTVVETPGDGRFHYFDLTDAAGPEGRTTLFANISTSRTPLKRTSIAGTESDGTVQWVVPEGLEPGDTLALQYVDAFGDLLLDVPEVPDVEVVEPTDADRPRITDAMPRSIAGQRACVCGVFPGPDAWSSLLLDGEPVGAPSAASSRMAWVRLPADAAPGEHVFTGSREAGFAESDRATTRVLRVRGQLDADKLLRLETTPMRLWVEGTEEPIVLRVQNLTPGVISINGGEDQEIRTTGGSPNQLERTVQGLSPGDFNIRYEMAAGACPCSGED